MIKGFNLNCRGYVKVDDLHFCPAIFLKYSARGGSNPR